MRPVLTTRGDGFYAELHWDPNLVGRASLEAAISGLLNLVEEPRGPDPAARLAQVPASELVAAADEPIAPVTEEIPTTLAPHPAPESPVASTRTRHPRGLDPANAGQPTTKRGRRSTQEALAGGGPRRWLLARPELLREPISIAKLTALAEKDGVALFSSTLQRLARKEWAGRLVTVKVGFPGRTAWVLRDPPEVAQAPAAAEPAPVADVVAAPAAPPDAAPTTLDRALRAVPTPEAAPSPPADGTRLVSPSAVVDAKLLGPGSRGARPDPLMVKLRIGLSRLRGDDQGVWSPAEIAERLGLPIDASHLDRLNVPWLHRAGPDQYLLDQEAA